MSISDQTTWTLLGTGTSTGVPLIGCSCKVCRSRNPKNKRLRVSTWIQSRGKSIIIDTGPDFRTQALRAKIPRVDAVLYSHPHADHCHGIDELRSYNFLQKEPIPIYGNEWTMTDLPQKFAYIFNQAPSEGGGIPHLEPHLIPQGQKVMNIQGVPVEPIANPHGSSHESLGFRIDSIASVTDCSYITPQSLDRLRGLSVLVLDCVRLEPHRTHLNLDRALEIISELRPERSFLTHLGHEFDHDQWNKKLPKGTSLAFDGLKFKR